jgi:hypothetical protein
MAAGEALDVIGRWLGQLFHYTNTGRQEKMKMESGN